MKKNNIAWISALTIAGAACGGSDDGDCDIFTQEGCSSGEICEEVIDDEPACFAPVVVSGSVFDLEDGSAVAGARIVALDGNRSPVSDVAITDENGNYSLPIPSVRDENGDFAGARVTLRADAQGFQSYPGGLRRSLPIDTGAAEPGDFGWVLDSSLTQIGLLPLDAGAGSGIIAGTVELPPNLVGVMVAAEDLSTGRGYTAIADRSGDYAIFNVPEGDFEVAGYGRGWNYDSGQVELEAGAEATVNLALSDEPASSVTGKVEIVAAGDIPNLTSIILVLESTFDEALGRGDAPPGLRAPDPGIDPNIESDFTIEGVPAGDYVLLAAFEDDLLVRDPDPCKAGTDFVFQSVGTDEAITVDQSFKVTAALQIIEPGPGVQAEGVSGSPTFRWEDDASEDRYEVEVYDSFGDLVWETTIPGVEGGTPEVAYEGPDLEEGMYYQLRAISIRETPGGDCINRMTEDLKGVFFLDAE